MVGLTSIFTGMVLALQSYTGFSRFSESAIQGVVVLSITRTSTVLLLGYRRSGAAIAAEIGTMKVTEQIDALETLSIIHLIILSSQNFEYYFTPASCSWGYYWSYGWLFNLRKSIRFNPTVYLQNTYNFVEFIDVFGLVKASVLVF